MKRLSPVLFVLSAVLLIIMGTGWQEAALAVPRIVIKAATAYPDGTTIVDASKRFAQLVAERSGGEIEIRLFTGGAMGGDRDIAEQVAAGTLDMHIGGLMQIAMFNPTGGFLDSPYVMRDYTHYTNVWRGELGQRILGEIEQRGNQKLLGWMYRGARHTTANKPIHKPEDLRGIKIRMPEVKSWINVWEAIGAVCVPIALPELYTSLQLGVVEASEGPFDQFLSYHLYKVQKYLILTEHMYSVCPMWINRTTFNRLTATQQQIITSAAREALDWGTEVARQSEKDLLERLKKEGMQVIIPDREAFRKAAEPGVRKNFTEIWKGYTWDDVLKYQ